MTTNLGAPPLRPAHARVGHRLALTITALGAIIPTVLSAQGMITVARDALHLPLIVALALATFLEIALVASALLARAAVQRGGNPHADTLAVWIFSGVSGTLSALHEVVGAHGSWGPFDGRSALAMTVRISAPLCAAWLWHRILVADEATLTPRPTRSQNRRNRLMLSVAAAAAEVQRLPEGGSRRARAENTLRGRHVRLLSVIPATDAHLREELAIWLAAVGGVDHLPEQTRVSHYDLNEATGAALEEAPAVHTRARRTADAIPDTLDDDVTVDDDASFDDEELAPAGSSPLVTARS